MYKNVLVGINGLRFVIGAIFHPRVNLYTVYDVSVPYTIEYRRKNGSTFKKWSRFSKQFHSGAILVPLFFQWPFTNLKCQRILN